MAIDPNQLSVPERLLWNNGVRNPNHIDLEGIANHHGVRVVHRHLDGCAARLVAFGDKAVISVGAENGLGRQRFSLAHELAHWICDRNRGSFRCANEDISPQNAEAKSVEAYANVFASQLILPDYLVDPWVQGKRATLDVASSLATEFSASLTASVIKLVRRAAAPAFVACHSQTGVVWFQKNKTLPFDFYVKRELHQDTEAFRMVYGSTTGMSRPRKEPADRWLSGPNAYQLSVESQSIKLPDVTVLTIVSLVK